MSYGSDTWLFENGTSADGLLGKWDRNSENGIVSI
jgi:hypothetical protein